MWLSIKLGLIETLSRLHIVQDESNVWCCRVRLKPVYSAINLKYIVEVLSENIVVVMHVCF